MATARVTRQQIEQFLANPECEANVLSALHGVVMEEVAGAAGFASESGPSPAAMRAGASFERRMLTNDAETLRQALVKAGSIDALRAGLLDLRLRPQGGPIADLEHARLAFDEFLRSLSTSAPTFSLIAGGCSPAPE